MQYSASVSVIILASSAVLLGQNSLQAYRHDLSAGHTNEWKLASLVPGQTRFTKVDRILGRPSPTSSDRTATWTNCLQQLVVESDQTGVVQTIRVSKVSDGPILDCYGQSGNASQWKTGLGLKTNDSTERAISIYGAPTSRSPSTKGGQQLELLYYAFDWAGPDVPQVMEVLCTPERDGKPGRVVEITLAAPSL